MLREALFICMRGAIKTYARLMLDLDVVWHETPPPGAKIIAPNHPTTIDPFLVAALFPGEPRVLIEETIFNVPVGGPLLRLLEQVPVIAGHGRIAYETAKWLLAEGQTVVIFPEGHVSPPEGGCMPPHTGVARLAMETGAPVVPLGIHLDRARIHTSETRIDGQAELGTWYLRGPYAMTVGSSLRLTGDVTDHAHVHELSDDLMHKIMHLADEGGRRWQPAPANVVGQVSVPRFDTP